MSRFVRETAKVGDRLVTIETGRIAKQAHGAVLVSSGETIVLVTVCGSTEPRAGVDFLPLTVDYIEKTFAAGKIPGGFFKREGRLRDAEILVSRLIDRPCRPLFPDGYRNDVQIIATVLSFDQENPADVLAMIGASAALHLSPIPWNGPIGGVRVARLDGRWVTNPTYSELEQSDCDLVVAASRDAIVMVEGEADEMSEEDLIEALWFGKEAVQPLIDLIEAMRREVGEPKWDFVAPPKNPELEKSAIAIAGPSVQAACRIADKHARHEAFQKALSSAITQLTEGVDEKSRPSIEKEIKEIFEELKYKTMREQVLNEGRRVDGRDYRSVRPISIELGFLPRVHGSALFTRGETQAIVTTTLGTFGDEQRIEALTGETVKRFLLHYNFPPYSVGEVRPLRGPGRREIGHGYLAERSLARMIPDQEAFPYVIRIVSEITESNGSTSMATVCGGSLSLMDAGVPIKAPVAGVAMGLIKEGERWAVLTDIIGDEDHLGDMDFKVCGTKRGVTGIQMDIKISGLSKEIMFEALLQARAARLEILDKMIAAIPAPRPELSRWAPRITTLRVKPDQIRFVIGPGGKTIKGIIDQTGVQIDIQEDGTIHITSTDAFRAQKAMDIILNLTAEPEVGRTYRGIVKRLEPYGAFIEITPNTEGLCHISDVAWERVDRIEDVLKVGDEVEVMVTSIEGEGRIRLSRKAVLPKPESLTTENGRERAPVRSERKEIFKDRLSEGRR
ncbi:MAG: polyribonucleotide nucleotidyltransferase [Sandaracinaceae bacterium]|nr:polyribonucleotide nucleotidyltransferase [Sandaracinaceae bacterium]